MAIHIGAAELIDPGMAEQKTSFYPEGSSSGEGQVFGEKAEAGETPGEAFAARRSSWASSTGWSGSFSNQWATSDWGFAGPDDRSVSYDRWFWTPQLWVWGSTLEDAVQDYIARGWLKLDREMIEWLQRSHDGGSQRASVLGSDTGSVRGSVERSDSRKVKAVELDSDEEEKTNSSKEGSQKAGRKPNTGKEVLPSHDGKSITMREYERRVRLFQSSTGIDKEFQASKLIQHLTGDAWAATESLDVGALKCDTGVEMLLKHLWGELEPLEYLRTFNVLSQFYRQFKRERGQEMTSYDMEFRSHCKRLEEVGGALTGTARAYWFLEKASISEELKRQVISGANGLYEYDRLRASLVAIVPQVKRHEEAGQPQTNRWPPKNNHGSGKPAHKVHAVELEEPADGEAEKEAMGEERSEDGDAEGEAARMEWEAEVLLTHAARKRSEFNKNRGFGKQESTDDREKRIAEMKQRMPCAACKAAGFTRYGHWHGDASCPMKQKDDGKPNGKAAGHTFVVTQEPIDESDSDDCFFVGMIMSQRVEVEPKVEATLNGSVILATSGKLREMTQMLALADTCCARTVAGQAWIDNHLMELAKRGIPYHVVADEQPFRFGDGPRIVAQFAVIFPIFLGQKKNAVLLRTSVVQEDVPLLISSKALKMLGTVVDLDGECYVFRRLKTTASLTTTPTGHIGFEILVGNNYLLDELFGMDWQAFDGSAMEVAFSQRDKDNRVMITCIPQNVHRGSRKNLGNVFENESEREKTAPMCGAVSGSIASASNLGVADPLSHHVLGQHECEASESVEEGRLCASPISADIPGCDDTSDLDGGAASSCLLHHEASQGEGVAQQLEKVCQGRTHGAVCGETSPIQQGLLEEDQGHAGDGVGDLGRRRGSHNGPQGTDHGNSDVSKLQRLDGREAEQDDKGVLLGMCNVPSVQGNSLQGHCGQTSCGGSGDGETTTNRRLQGKHLGRHGRDGRHSHQEGGEDSSAFRILGRFVKRYFPSKSGGISGGPNHSEQGGEGVDQGAASGQSEVSTDEPPAIVMPEAEIRKRIRAGNLRRRRAKQGTVKRILGNCKVLLASICLFTAASVVNTGAVFSKAMYGDEQPDVVEIFGGSAEVSMQFATKGWNVSQPVDLKYGSDLRNSQTREEVRNYLRTQRPRLAIVSYPCRYWTLLTNVNFSSPQRKRKLEQLRREEEPFLELVEDIFEIQTSNGLDALAENPIASASFRRPPIQRVLCRKDVFAGVSHGCRFELRCPRSGLLLKKPTMWISTSQEICDELSQRCKNAKHNVDHEHGRCQGSTTTQHAGRYTPQMGKAIHRGFVKMLKRKDPSRLKRMLLAIRKQFGRPEARKDLRWTEETIEKALNAHNSVFAADGQIDETVDAHGQEHRASADIGQSGVTFEVPEGRKLDAGLRSALAKIHANLGHPSVQDLQRFLRGAGATQEMIEATSWLRCGACAKTVRPRTHRSVRIPPHDIQFNDQIMIDCFHVKDIKKRGHWFMSMLDRATMYHVVTRIEDHSPNTFIEVFRNSWAKWAGFPLEISIDLERGFGSAEFATALGEAGVSVVPIASQAHWQHGKIERHGGILKHMLERTIHAIDGKTGKQIEWAAEEVTHAKNCLIREHGFSPAQLVFGKEPRGFGELEANGEACSFHFSVGDRHTQVAKRMNLRNKAKMAFIQAQAQEMLNQTARNRTRPWHEPQVGDRCFFFHEFRKKGTPGLVKGWYGPALVVGHQGQSNIWIVFGGKCFLIAQEHCREAIGEENMYGRPEVQEAIAIFKNEGQGKSTYLDLTSSRKVEDQDLDNDILDEFFSEDEEMIPDERYQANISRVKDVPNELLQLCREPGWKTNAKGEPLQVAYHGYTFRIPNGHIDVGSFPFRTTWILLGGKWRLAEEEVRWGKLEDPQEMIPGGPAEIVITVFHSKTRKQECLDDMPEVIKRQRVDVFLSLSKRKAQRALDKEVPYNKIPHEHRELYKQAETKEWESWLQYDAIEALTPEQSKKVLESNRERVLKSRFVYRDKHAGLIDEHGQPLSVKAKARLCVQGQHDPDCLTGEVKVDAPTIQHASMLTFLHCVISFGWLKHWRNGDISSAFLQGEEAKGEPLYMFLPERGLPNLNHDQVLRLKRPVYGRPDAPRAWYEQISSFIMNDMGYERSILDPALFVLRQNSEPVAMLVLHVDDLMVATNGSAFSEKTVDLLFNRFPFGEWSKVADSASGVTYCGKEIVVTKENGQDIILLKQKGFVDGRLETVPVSPERKKTPDAEVTEEERSDFRSVLGSLQWLSNQSRPDISFMVNQLQKRVNKLTVRDLEVANRVVKIVKSVEGCLRFHDLGKDVAVVSWHDAGLYNSVGTELDEEDGGLLQSLADKRLLFSQKGCMVGFCKREDLERTTPVPANYVAWKTKTDKRILESSFAAETHAAIMGHGCGHYQRTLLLEVYYGQWVVKEPDQVPWENLMPLRMITDCKSVYDTIKKDGQSVGDRSNAIHVAILRQLCVANCDPVGERARMLWVPTRHQVADPLTKAGRHKEMHTALAGSVTFHGISAKERLKSRRSLGQCES